MRERGGVLFRNHSRFSVGRLPAPVWFPREVAYTHTVLGKVFYASMSPKEAVYASMGPKKTMHGSIMDLTKIPVGFHTNMVPMKAFHTRMGPRKACISIALRKAFSTATATTHPPNTHTQGSGNQLPFRGHCAL